MIPSGLQPEAGGTQVSHTWVLKPTETEIINVCCFKLLNFVVICYEAIYDMHSFASGFFSVDIKFVRVSHIFAYSKSSFTFTVYCCMEVTTIYSLLGPYLGHF